MSTQDNQKNLESIARTVRRANISKDFALIFAECNSLEEQRKYVEELKKMCGKDGVVLTEVKLLEKPPTERLLPIVKEHLEKEFNHELPERLGIQITGLELPILLDEDEQVPAVLQILNMNRESYYKELPFPFVFWLPEYAIIKVANAAPDFWSIQVGSAAFCGEEARLSLLPENIETGKSLSVWQDKLAQIPVLERLLDAQPSPEVRLNLLIKSADAYYYIGKTNQAQQRYEQAIKENEDNDGDPQKVAEAYNKLGIIYSDMGEDKETLEEAENSLLQYLELVAQAGRTDLSAMGYNHLGLVYDKHKEYQQALKYYKEALKISRRHGHRKLEADVLGNMGLLYRKQSKYEDALNLHHQALSISRELDDIQGEALDLSNIGLIYYEQKAHEKAIDYYNQALLNNVRIGNKLEEMNQLILLGDAWKALGDFSKALEKYNSAKKIAEEININLFIVFDKLEALFSTGALNDDAQGVLLLKEAIEKSHQLQKADKELHYWEKLCALYRIGNEITEKNKCLMHMAGILDKQIRKSEDRYKKIGYYKELLNIYKELGKAKELNVCRQKMEELYDQIIAWSDPMVNMEDNQPILQVGKNYNLNLQIVQTLPRHPIIYQVKIPPFKKEQKISNIIKPRPIEGRRISEGKAKPIEAKKNSSRILNEKEKNKNLKGKMNTETKEPSIQSNIDKNKQDYYIPPIKQKRQERIDKVSSPLPPPYKSSKSGTAVSFRFKSPEIGFDRDAIDILLSEDNISDIESLVITPKSVGVHWISMSVRVKTPAYKNDFVIPLRVVKSLTYRESVEYYLQEYQKDEKINVYIELNALDSNSKPLGSLINAVDGAVESGKSVAIIGEFGTGKTTFTRYYEYKRRCEWLENPQKSRLVIFLDLNEYSRKKNTMTMFKWIVDNIKHEIGFDIKRKEFKKYLNEKKLLLIFDGLDEVANIPGEDAINKTIRKINNISHKGSPVIITCCKAFLESEVDQQNLKDFTLFFIDNLDIDQITGFVRKKIPKDWQNFIEYVFPDGKKESADSSEKNKEKDNAFLRLVRRPLFLDMMVGAYQSGHLRSINNQADLYEILTNDWMSEESKKKENSLIEEDMKQIIQELAFKMFLDNQFSYTVEELKGIINDIMDKLSNTLKQNYDNKTVLKDITNASFLVRDKVDNVKVEEKIFAFRHRSFVEYFTVHKLASELKERNTENFSIRILYEEIFEFLACIMTSESGKDEDLTNILGDPQFPFKARVNAIPPLRKQRNKKAIIPLLNGHTDIETSHPLLRFVCGYTLAVFQEMFPEEFKSPKIRERLVEAYKKEKNSLIRLRMALLLTDGEYMKYKELNPDYEFFSSSLDEILEPSGTIEAYDKILKVNREHHLILEESVRILTIYVMFNAEAWKFRSTLLRYIFKFGCNHKSERIQRISIWSMYKLGLFEPKNKKRETLRLKTRAGRIVVNNLKNEDAPISVKEIAKNIVAKCPEYFLTAYLIKS